MTARPYSVAQITFALVGFLFLLEITSGILQGYYIPLISDLVLHLGITDADFNWFEAAQLLLSAIAVPILAKLGDMFGHKRMLLVSTALTAAASWWLVVAGDFTTFLIAWALQGFAMFSVIAKATGRWIGRLGPTYYVVDPVFRLSVEGAGFADVAGRGLHHT